MPELSKEDSVLFLKSSELQDGDVITFVSEGRIANDMYKHNKLQINISLPSGEVKRMSINDTSKSNLIAKLGSDTKEWVNKNAIVSKKKMLIAGEDKDVLILNPE